MVTWDEFPASAESKRLVSDLSGTIGGGNSAHEVFTALCRHGRVHFTYYPRHLGSVALSLQMRLFECESISDLLNLLYLFRNRQGRVKAHLVKGEHSPLLTPTITHPGIRIANNVQRGNGRMIFAAGHTVAEIEGHQYDVISGLDGAALDRRFLLLERQAQATPTFTCRLGGVEHTFVKIGMTGNELQEFRATPPVTI